MNTGYAMTLKSKIDFTPLAIFSSNYVWACTDWQRRETYIVDPGEPNAVLEFLHKHELKLKGILITHSHNDHIGGISHIIAQHCAPVYGPEHPKLPRLHRTLSEGDSFELWPGCVASIMNLPGHLPEHIAYLLQGETLNADSLLCGDVIFSSGCGRMFDGTPAQFCDSVQRISELDPNTILYCTHEYTLDNIAFAQHIEPDNEALEKKRVAAQASLAQRRCTLPTTVEIERETNPFMRCKSPKIFSALARIKGAVPRDSVQAFEWLRALKDDF